MSTPVPTSVAGNVQVAFTSTSQPISQPATEKRQSAISTNFKLAFAAGYGAGQCDIQYSEVVSLSASTPQSIVLSGDPTRKDWLGNQLAMARLKMILVRNLNAVEADAVTIGGGTHSLFAAQEPINGGGVWLMADFGSAGIAVVSNGVADTIQLNPGSTDAQVQVFLLGTSQ